MKVRTTKIAQSDHDSAARFFSALAPWVKPLPNTLDMFARDGAITVSKYRMWVGDLDLWELGPEHEPALRKFHPREVKIGCSYLNLRACPKSYDLVVIDTPQGLHQDADRVVHAEHFDVFKDLRPIVNDDAWVVLYVNRQPYDKSEVGSCGYDEYDEYDFGKWMDRRQAFYGAYPLDVSEERAVKAYRHHLGLHGLAVTQVVLVPCLSDVPGKSPYAFRLGLQVRGTK